MGQHSHTNEYAIFCSDGYINTNVDRYIDSFTNRYGNTKQHANKYAYIDEYSDKHTYEYTN